MCDEKNIEVLLKRFIFLRKKNKLTLTQIFMHESLVLCALFWFETIHICMSLKNHLCRTKMEEKSDKRNVILSEPK